MIANLVIELHDGQKILTTEDNYIADDLAALINDSTLVVVAIGNAVINRNMIRAVYEDTPV